MPQLAGRVTAVCDKDQDIQVGNFLMGLGMRIERSDVQSDGSGYWKYYGSLRGFEVTCRVASKNMNIGHRIMWMDISWEGKIFFVTALDSMNVYPPTKTHIDNLEISLARVVYNK